MSVHASAPLPEGISLDVWQAIGARIDTSGRWETPERDADGTITTWVTRYELSDGKARKIARSGGKRGLTFIPPLDAYAGAVAHDPVYVVEGPTDTAAGLMLGLDMVGRYSVSGGDKLVGTLLAGRHACVILENDGKSPGEPGPGQVEGRKFALKLVGACVSVRVISPPHGIKDLRAWHIAGATAEVVRAAMLVAPLLKPVELEARPQRQRNSPCTDLGNAERLVRRFGEDLRFCFTTGNWIAWNGKLWLRDESGFIMRRAGQTARSIYVEAAKANNPAQSAELGAWAKTSESRFRLEAMASIARSQPGIAITPDELDRDPWAFNCTNGTIDLRTGRLRPHRREDLISRMAPVAFDGEAAAPIWKTFLNRVFADDTELIRFVQQFLGMSLTGDISEQILAIFYGEGNNGKNVLLDTVAGVMGEYASQAAPDLLTLSKFKDHPTEIADLLGRRLVTASETEEGSRLRLQLVKRLTGDVRLKGRFMRRDYFEFDRTFKMVLVTNNLPEIRENSEAAWRRVRLVPFSVVIPEAERDTKLLDKLRKEHPGILGWLVRGCLDWQANGLSKPAAMVSATAKYRGESDHVGRFLAECCTLGDGLWSSSAALRTRYESWCRAHAEHPLSTPRFSDGLTRHRCGTKKLNGIRGWVGVEICQ